LKWQHQDFGRSRNSTPLHPPKKKFHPSKFRAEFGSALGFLILGWIAVSVHSGITGSEEKKSQTEVQPQKQSQSQKENPSTSLSLSDEALKKASIKKRLEDGLDSSVELATRASSLPLPSHYPRPDTLQTSQGGVTLHYAPDSVLQASVEKYLNRYRPERAVIMACDLKTGVIKAFAERDSLPNGPGVYTTPKLAIQGKFPAASLSKIVTAYAALRAGYKPEDSLPQQGSTVTLYRRQVREPSGEKFSKMTLKYGFAQSANPLFGLLGMRLGGARLQSAAEALGFNQPSTSAFLSASHYSAPDSGYPLAEVASGFTRLTTLTPWHALALARAIEDDGDLRPLAFSARASDAQGKSFLSANLILPHPSSTILDQNTLVSLREMMEETVRRGTARKGFLKSMRAEVWNAFEMGGKTGSLDGDSPAGRYEWYAGYVKPREGDGPGLALCVLTINGEYLAVHTTHLTGLILKDWGRAQLKQATRHGKAEIKSGPSVNSKAG
jgi:membrane peptidoglycan carboxypeptidase